MSVFRSWKAYSLQTVCNDVILKPTALLWGHFWCFSCFTIRIKTQVWSSMKGKSSKEKFYEWSQHVQVWPPQAEQRVLTSVTAEVLQTHKPSAQRSHERIPLSGLFSSNFPLFESAVLISRTCGRVLTWFGWPAGPSSIPLRRAGVRRCRKHALWWS